LQGLSGQSSFHDLHRVYTPLFGGSDARKESFYVAGLSVHVVQRGNNRQAIFFDDSVAFRALRLPETTGRPLRSDR